MSVQAVGKERYNYTVILYSLLHVPRLETGRFYGAEVKKKKKKKKKKKGEKVLASNGSSELSIVLQFFYIYVTLKTSSPSPTLYLISP